MWGMGIGKDQRRGGKIRRKWSLKEIQEISRGMDRKAEKCEEKDDDNDYGNYITNGFK